MVNMIMGSGVFFAVWSTSNWFDTAWPPTDPVRALVFNAAYAAFFGIASMLHFYDFDRKREK